LLNYLANGVSYYSIAMVYAIVDIETTGGYAASHGITEIAIYLHDGEKLLRRFETLVNPVQRIPYYITALTGITNEMVATAPSFEDVAPQVDELLREAVFVAHNVNFDYSFVKRHLEACGFEVKYKKLCTVRLARKLFPGLPSYSLGNLCRHLGIQIQNRHRAGGDAGATVQLFEHLLANGGEEQVRLMLKKSSAEQWLPLHLNREDVLQLPQVPGVYYFHDAKHKVIYVGKAVNLRKRVSGHFTNNDAERKRQNLLRSIYKITFQECATELEALVLESAEIKRLWPRYNVSQKNITQSYALYQFEDARGYLRLAIDRKKKNLQPLYSFNLLHEGQVMLKKMVEEFELNEKLCFLDKTPFTEQDLAFADTPAIHNGKVRVALEALEEKLPTFAIVDQGRNENEKLCLLVERGSFWGMGYLPVHVPVTSVEELKGRLNPYSDNDTIRNSIYQFVTENPDKRIDIGK
jgi:DNA polymerase III subunit epsilon